MSTFSITDEIARLRPVVLDADTRADPDPYPASPSATQPSASETDRLEELSQNIARLGRQQLRTNQTVEFLEAQLTEAKELAHEYRREASRLEEESTHSATLLLEIIDALDDVHALAQKIDDEAWAENIERLIRLVLRTFERIGIHEISALGETFDPEEHTALETVEPAEGQAEYEIVRVVRRGFRMNGAPLRHAEVISTQRGEP